MKNILTVSALALVMGFSANVLAQPAAGGFKIGRAHV